MTVESAFAIAGSAAGVLALVAAWPTVLAWRKEHRADRMLRAVEALHGAHAEVAASALEASPSEWKLPGLPLLGRVEWQPTRPLPLNRVELVLAHDQSEPRSGVRERERLLSGMPHRSGLPSYSKFLTAQGGRHGLFDGRCYRLVRAENHEAGLRLTFEPGSYFDFLDTSEVLAYETQTMLEKGKPPLSGAYRRALGDPWDFTNRVANLGISTLTLRRSQDATSFLLHRRDGGSVTHNPGRLGVAPGGEFAPADVTLESLHDDLDIWRNQMREYAEEFLNHEEAQRPGGAWVDYSSDPIYSDLSAGLEGGWIQFSVLGLVVDPLTWKPDLLTVCSFDADCFDRVFAGLVDQNEEGMMVLGRKKIGLPFDEPTVTRYAQDKATTPVAEACLRLAWANRDVLALA